MTEQNSGQLEREAEQIRADIAQTAEALQDRMSPGKIVDEFMTYMKNSDGTLALDNLRRQARDNPMALAMIGSGFAWLAFSGRVDRAPTSDNYTSDARRDPSPSSIYPTTPQSGTDHEDLGVWDTGSAVGDAVSGLADKASGLAEQAKDAAGRGADRLREAAVDVSDRARRMGHDAADRGHSAADDVRDFADRGRRSVMDVLDQEPLVIGAIGLAVGAALGAMLPSTRFEDATFGKTRDSLLRDAEKAVDAARKVGGEALEAAKTASIDEGLVIEGKAVVDRVGEVAKAVLSAGKDAAEREIGRTEVAPSSPSADADPSARSSS